MWFLTYTENRKNAGNDTLTGYKEGNAEQEALNIRDEMLAIRCTSLLMI